MSVHRFSSLAPVAPVARVALVAVSVAALVACGSSTSPSAAGDDAGSGDDGAAASDGDGAAASDGDATDGDTPADAHGDALAEVAAADGDATGAGAVWKPAVGTTWQWQLDTPVDTTVGAQVFDIDLFDNDASVVAALHAKGRKAICYVNVGAWESWRADQAAFPAAVIGKAYPGWAGEKFLDIRRIDLLSPILRARFDACRSKGFDGLEPDNVDTYQADTGFPLTAQDQRTYDAWLVAEAHARGLSIGLKNDGDQAAQLVTLFDWALTEDCWADAWCDQMKPFVAAGKAVFMAEYTDRSATLAKFCPTAASLSFSGILKDRALTASRQACP
jgi:hypothetical protein